ncbi:MAG: zinc-dependent metalloprotease family protein [Candidatus Hodarchaeota archaeon]
MNILTDSGIPESWLLGLDQNLVETFSFSDIFVSQSIKLPNSCWIRSRHQFNAQCLLSFARSLSHYETVLLITSKDTYVPGLNFVFGVASKGQGAVVSTYRLGNDPSFLQKEIIHELGHVFGLNHCTIPCVMTFSNSVWEAQQKNSKFCYKCLKELRNNLKLL